MTQALSGGAVALVLLALWLLRRPRPQLMRSTDGAAVAALNRIQMELVVTEPAAGQGSRQLKSSCHLTMHSQPSPAHRPVRCWC